MYLAKSSSLGSELKSSITRELSYFDECELISLLRYSKYPLVMLLCGL